MRILLTFLAASAAIAAGNPDFSGTWEFAPVKSQNIGMMAQMKITATVRQSATELVISSKNAAQSQPSETRFDLSGKSMHNETPMSDKAETISKWDGDKLVTTWTTPGSVAGTQTVRTETRSLSPDGRVMTVESTRGKSAPMVMIFERK